MFHFGKIRIDENNANRLLRERKITVSEYNHFVMNYLYQTAMPKNVKDLLKIKDMEEYMATLPDVCVNGCKKEQLCEIFRNLQAFQTALSRVKEKLERIDQDVEAHSLGYENGHLGESTVSAPSVREVAAMITDEMKSVEPADLNSIQGLSDSLAISILKTKISIAATTLGAVLNGAGVILFQMIAVHGAMVD